MNAPKPAQPVPSPALSSASSSARTGQRWPAIWGPRLWALLALALVLTLYRVWVVHHSGISLFFDEAQYWDWSRHLQWGYYSKPPMIAGLIKVGSALFGDGVIGIKLLPMLLYPATAVAMVGLARALWPTSSGVRTGVVAGALFLTLPVVGTMGLFASTDAPLLLCWTLAAWALWRAQVTNRMQHWVLLGVACGLGIMSKYTMVAFALTALWVLWAVHGPKRGLLRVGPWVSVLITLLIVGPNLLWNAQNGFPTLQHTAELTTQSGRDGGPMSSLAFLAGQALMLGPLAVIGALWLWWRGRRAEPTPAAPRSQWASSTQMAPPSQWAATTTFSTNSQPPGSAAGAGASGKPVARTSAYYLASVSSYRFLWALSLPLIAIATVQAFSGGANLNWAAPAVVGLSLLIASRVSPPLIPLAARRPQGWLVAMLLSNLALTSAALHVRDVLPEPTASRLDALVRMRGWQESFKDIEPVLLEPVVTGLPVLADSRVLITQALYNWRAHKIRAFYWNPAALKNNHYLLQHSLPNKIGPDVLLITANPKPDDITQRFAIVRHMKSTQVKVAENRYVVMHAFFLRGFLGYDQQTYMEQSGSPVTSMETP